MKTLLLILVLSICASAQSYPSAIFTPLVAADNIQTTLTSPMLIGDAVAIVASSTGWAINQVAYICETTTGTGTAAKCTSFEAMLVTGVSTNVLTVTRSYGGTTATAHASGKTIAVAVTSIYNKTLSLEVLAIETALGINLANVAIPNPLTVAKGGTGAQTMTGVPVGAGTAALSPVAAAADIQYLRSKPNQTSRTYEFAAPPLLNSADYNFPAQTPGGSLTAGSRTITLTPCPLGVAGTDSLHYLYLSGGSGTAEAALITGGTCTSGLSTGNITLTVANSHSGAWTVSSATSGIQEAVRSVTVANGYGAGPSIFIPAGQWPIYATITVDNYASLIGAGSNSTILQKASPAIDVIYIGDGTSSLTGIGAVYRDFQIEPLSGVTDTGGYAIRARYRYNPTIANVTIYGDVSIGRIKNGIKFDSCLTFSLLNTKILNVTNIGLELTATSPDQVTGRIVAVDVTSPGTTNDMVYFHGNILSMFIDGLQMQGGFRNWHITTTGGQFTESQISNIIFDSASNTAFALDGTGSTFKLGFSNIELSTIAGVPSTQGMVFDGTGAAILTQITINNLTGGVNASNQIGTALSFINANNTLVSNSHIQGAGGGVGDTAIQIQGTTNNIVLTGNVIGYAYDGSTAGSQAYRAVYVPSGTHAGMTITGNRIYGSSVALGIAGAHTNFQAVNNSLAGGTTTSFTGTGTAYIDNPADPAGLNGARNYIATESGANSAIAGTLTGATLATGLKVRVLLAHTLGAGANTFNLNAGGAVAIKSHLNVANNIAAAYAVGSVVELWYDGTRWQDLAQ